MDPGDESGGFEIRLQVYRHLFLMALADGELDDREIAMIRAITEPLGFKPEVFDLVADELVGRSAGGTDDGALADAYATLGVSPDASDAEIKQTWKRKMAAFHPDKIQGKNLDPELIELANQKSAEINQAYETIKAARLSSFSDVKAMDDLFSAFHGLQRPRGTGIRRGVCGAVKTDGVAVWFSP